MMTAHILYGGLDDAQPATLSPIVVQGIIRGAIGFTGLLFSDDLAMNALSGTPLSRAEGALAAGCDIALYCPGDAAGNESILQALPDDPGLPVRLRNLRPASTVMPDLPAWVAERTALLETAP